MLELAPGLAVPEEAVDIRFFRAGGPGGQNVNKVETAVQLRFDPALASVLDEAGLARLLRLAGRRATKEGVIVLVAQRFRTQERNRADALARLAALIAEARQAPVRRKATRPTLASKTRRLASKARRSEIKGGRGRVRDTDG